MNASLHVQIMLHIGISILHIQPIFYHIHFDLAHVHDLHPDDILLDHTVVRWFDNHPSVVDTGPVDLLAEVDIVAVGRNDLVYHTHLDRYHSRERVVESVAVEEMVVVHVDLACLEQTSDRGTQQMDCSDLPFVDLVEEVVERRRFFHLVEVEVGLLRN